MYTEPYFCECDKYELNSGFGFSNNAIGAIEKHVEEYFGKNGKIRDDFYAVENHRFALVGNEDQERVYKEGVNSKRLGYYQYDRTLVAGNQKVQYGFDFIPLSHKDNFVPMPFKKTNKKKKK